MQRLDGQNAVITGGASGIGLATARLFLEEGARVTIADINSETLGSAAEELGALGSVHAVEADVSRMSDGARIVEEADAAHGGIDVVVCAAGIPSRSRLHKLEEDEWDRIIGVNLKGIYTVVKAAVPKLKQRGGGAIVTIGSEMGFVADREAPAYNASKGGVIMFTKALALDLIADNIRVNSLCPRDHPDGPARAGARDLRGSGRHARGVRQLGPDRPHRGRQGAGLRSLVPGQS